MRDPTLAVTARRLRQTPVVDFGAAPGYGPILTAGLFVFASVFHLSARAVPDGYVRNEDRDRASSTTCRTCSCSRLTTASTTPSSRCSPPEPTRERTASRTRACSGSTA